MKDMETNVSDNQKKKPKFMAMSKLLGVVCSICCIAIMLYAMYEMHISQQYESLTTLILCIFGLMGVYIAFYLLMAKAEHIEVIRQQMELELKNAINSHADEQYIDFKEKQIEDVTEALGQTLQQEVTNPLGNI